MVTSSKSLDTQDVFINILKQYTGSLVTLNQYDENRIENQIGSKSVLIEINELRNLIAKAKGDLIKRGEATELFGKEFEGKFEDAVAAVYQGFDGRDVYLSAEEKAANLLYLVIKNHGFVDGNKRIG